MKLFALDEELAAVKAEIAASGTFPPLYLLVSAAWYLRQRDTAQSLSIVKQAEQRLHISGATDPDSQRASARLQLTRAEAKWLNGELGAAETLLLEARARFHAINDAIGVGDADWLYASVWQDRGNYDRCVECLKQAGTTFQTVGDLHRADTAIARMQWYAAFSDPIQTAAEMAAHFGDESHTDPAAAAWVEGSKALIAEFSGAYGKAAAYFIQAYQAALRTGQYRTAVLMATNAGDKFVSLNDLASALEWDERGLELARKTGWQITIGQSLMQAGNALRLLGRTDEAQQALCESIDALAPVSGSRSYAIVLGYLGELALSIGDYQAAYSWFKQDEGCLGIWNQPDMLMHAGHGLARALAGIGRMQEAVSKAESALLLAREQGNVEELISTLQVLADLYRRLSNKAESSSGAAATLVDYLEPALAIGPTVGGHSVQHDLLEKLSHAKSQSNAEGQKSALKALAGFDRRQLLVPTDGAPPINVTLYYLELALAVSATVEGYVVPTDLLDDLAREYAAAGDYQRAYESAIAAGEARKKKYTQETIQRSVAMQTLLEARLGDATIASS